ncbi:CatB-related O-acetyltransferase [Methylobacterium sp. Leaf108]|uniref:CatB-related O-acetyltransferase n=1 Tax=Methylobacterium sp. Leaf108 TaxID=1736256 RepID=UPI0009EA0388|nr:CatB-related O-acetyltransferase [Methylobacterium sp. Leaf108]
MRQRLLREDVGTVHAQQTGIVPSNREDAVPARIRNEMPPAQSEGIGLVQAEIADPAKSAGIVAAQSTPPTLVHGRYLLTADLKNRLRERGVETSHGPGGMWIPQEAGFEGPCSLKWMDLYGFLKMGAFSYAVSGHYNNVEIGRYTSIGDDVQMGRGDHSISWISTSPHFYLNEKLFDVGHDFAGAAEYDTFRPDTTGAQGFVMGSRITVGHDVWIGHRAYIRQGITIGTGAIIGAYAVVTRDVPPYAVMVGNPARAVRFRFPEPLVARLLASRWWTLAPWQLTGIDLSRPEVSIDALERRVAESEPFAPSVFRVTDLL